MTIIRNENGGSDNLSSINTSLDISLDSIGGDYRSNLADFDALIDSTDDSASINSTNSKATSVDSTPNYHSSSNDKSGVHYEGNSVMSGGPCFLSEEDKKQPTAKRASTDNIPELTGDQSPRMRRPRRETKNEATSKTSNDDVSTLTKRLNRMNVKERQNAMYDVHGIPLDDEYCDQDGVKGNNIERDPERLQALLVEMDRLVEERLKFSKSSYAEGENFGEADLLANPNNEQIIQQRLSFLKYHLDDKDFGEGLRLAKKQNPEYVHAQRIKFLRADRYNPRLASGRMIRFFDTKKEYFCAPGYNKDNNIDRTSCLGRDLRLSDFSKEDLALWRTTGFLQMCGMRDRAKRAIVVMFGKVISDKKVPTALVMRAYLYAYNLWARDEATQLGGVVVIGYSMFTKMSSSPPAPLTKKGGYVGDNGHDSETDVQVIERHVKETFPELSELIKIGMSSQIRGAAMHLCIDHPLLHTQFEKIAAFMSTAAVARFRCHYAGADKSKNSIVGGSSQKEDSATRRNEHEGSNGDLNHGRSFQSEGDIRSDFNPHKELLYTLMTFGIPRDAIPINDVTGEVEVDFHQALFEAIEEREAHDRSLESEFLSSVSASSSASPEDIALLSLTSSIQSDKLWMSLTASSSSNISFSLFPSLMEGEDELDEGSSHSSTSLFGLPPVTTSESQSNMKDPIPDLSSSISAPPPKLAGAKIEPQKNDVIMGRGPWNRNHPGNLQLKSMLEREREKYEYVNRFERMRIVDAMLNELYEDYGARFLYKEKGANQSKTTSGNTTDDVWLEAKRDRAHDKITHDFRNLRRQKGGAQKSN